MISRVRIMFLNSDEMEKFMARIAARIDPDDEVFPTSTECFMMSEE